MTGSIASVWPHVRRFRSSPDCRHLGGRWHSSVWATCDISRRSRRHPNSITSPARRRRGGLLLERADRQSADCNDQVDLLLDQFFCKFGETLLFSLCPSVLEQNV